MKIVIVTEFVGPSRDRAIGGLDTRLLSLLPKLTSRHAVSVISSRQPGQPCTEAFKGVTIERVGVPREYRPNAPTLERLEFARLAVARCLSLCPDVVNGDGLVGLLASARIPRGRLSCPRVATVHEVWKGKWVTNLGLLSGFLGRIAEKKALSKEWTRFVAVSESTKRDLVQSYNIDPQKVDVVRNGIDLGEIERARKIEKGPVPTVTTVSRLVPQKRVDRVLETFALVVRQVPDARLVIIGEGPERMRLESICEGLGLGSSVEFRGTVPSRDAYLKLLAESDAFLLLSSSEGFGIAAFEALALGVPYVVSDLPAVREATNGGLGGFLVEGDAVESSANAIVRILSGRLPPADNALRDKMLRDADWAHLAELYSKSLQKACT